VDFAWINVRLPHTIGHILFKLQTPELAPEVTICWLKLPAWTSSSVHHQHKNLRPSNLTVSPCPCKSHENKSFIVGIRTEVLKSNLIEILASIWITQWQRSTLQTSIISSGDTDRVMKVESMAGCAVITFLRKAAMDHSLMQSVWKPKTHRVPDGMIPKTSPTLKQQPGTHGVDRSLCDSICYNELISSCNWS